MFQKIEVNQFIFKKRKKKQTFTMNENKHRIIIRKPLKKTKIIILVKPPQSKITTAKPQNIEDITKRQKRRLLTIEKAKSGRSKCKNCRQHIDANSFRIGLITFIPHRNTKWFHLKRECVEKLTWMMMVEKSVGWDNLPLEVQELAQGCWASSAINRISLSGICGPLDLNTMAGALTSRYNRFRSFRFALPESARFTKNWNWRCFLATMLVTNNREETMLAITDRLFQKFPDPESLLCLYNKPEQREKWTEFMDTEKLKHARMKMGRILYATKIIMEQHGGAIPTDRDELRKIPGVGAHVSSVTLAWIHEAPEFGIDVHVRRIMERWGYVADGMSEKGIEQLVKNEVTSDKLGHFSRAFVDHGQSVCGYVPDCANCYLNKACPSSSKYLDW